MTNSRRRTWRHPNGWWVATAVCLVAALSCTGVIGNGGSETSQDPSLVPDSSTPAGETSELVSHSGLRRLTITEYNNALHDLLRDDSRPGAAFMPTDPLTPFDNDYRSQSPSEVLITGAERLATEAAERLLADPERLTGLLPCSPSGAGDVACLREFVVQFGRRAFRRPLQDTEVDRFVSLHELALEANDWRAGVGGVVRAMLQDPNFLYRVEIGVPLAGTPGIVQLTDWEIATRLSFLIWATIPDEPLLDTAAAGKLSTIEEVREQAERMLEDSRAEDAVERFHAMWLGYSSLAGEGLSGDMRAESRALVRRVAFDEGQPWLSLLTSTETYVTPELAAHYGLAIPDEAGWVPYGDSGRGGILSHGSVLALGSKFDDTSPTVRGKELRKRLFCQDIKVPEGLPVKTDDPPGLNADDCKWERYAEHRAQGSGCEGCHALTDGLGFGLENYDATGAFRKHDVGKPECVISGEGEVAEIGPFNGPGELGQLLAQSPQVQACAIQQIYGFASGRSAPDELDREVLGALDTSLEGRDVYLRELLVEMVGMGAFRFRAIEEEKE